MTRLTSAYDELADVYHHTVDPDGGGLEDPIFDDLVGEVRGQRIAAVACGQGRDARRLADLGASVVGIDASEPLLTHARRLEQDTPRGVEYVHGDAHDLQPLADSTFDGVVCHMALMDIPELNPTVTSIVRVLRPGGWFVASIVHPCYKTPADGEFVDHVDGSVRRTTGRYFAEGPYSSPTRWDILPRTAYHRTLSTYINTFTAADLFVVRMIEPVGDRPVWKEVPGLLYFRCQHIPGHPSP
ncbi:class I SAM-dependent methyltransferase [Tenggerimyces flavus]|uniref:Methyltransferase domain-containing protein n=1 Tax=Tenggerimyces flavus TaxID=1708749 RepID=A0ABV7YBX7_9ACTN|nr:class I SAM-dependent methyltransferase [Tenggerimyces flavus]MBM7783478.1 ubiquinone/menaquinone biosynthesis C-methylase UbiE [Tenggerimyces flavus]